MRAGIIGTGRAAGFIDDEVRNLRNFRLPYGHAGAYREAEGVELVAGANRGKDRREQFGEKFGVTALYEDYRTMLAEEALDLVSVTTHAPSHAEMVIAAAEAGVKGIFCEKAMAVTLAECDAMLAACEANNVKLIIGHTRRWLNVYQQADSLLRGDEIGAVNVAVGYWGGSLVHSGTHAFDLIAWLLDSHPVAVYGALNRDPDYASTDYGAVDVGGKGFVEFANGSRAYIDAMGGKMMTFDFDFIGTNGVLRTMGNGLRMELVKPDDERVPRSADVELPPPNSASVRAVEELARCVRAGEEPKSNGVAGRWALEIAHGFHHSHQRNGARVSLPLEDRSLRVINR